MAKVAKAPAIAPPALPAVPPEPSPKEVAVMEAQRERRAKAPPAPKMKVSLENNVAMTEVVYPNRAVGYAMLMESLGTADPAFVDGLSAGLINAAKGAGGIDNQALDFMFAVVQGIQPRDQLEAMLAAQMAVVHQAIMASTRRLANAQTLPQLQMHEGAVNRLSRTYTTQLDALKRHRSTGQKVVVEHVHVHEGGQAIVGNVLTGGGVEAGRKRGAIS